MNLKNYSLQIPLLATLFMFVVIVGFTSCNQMDGDLNDSARVRQITTEFEAELSKIELPPKTAVNKSESFVKPGGIVSVTKRYRTEIGQEEFRDFFKKTLRKNGWIFNGTNLNHDNFCKGKFNATLTFESRTFWDDEADYYQLNFSLHGKPLIGAQEIRPAGCS